MKNYKKVYFRINTPSYYNSKFGVGFDNEEDRELFHSSITELFLQDGWTIKSKKYTSSGCTTVVKDKQELYLHPQSISGVVIVDQIPYIEQLLSNSTIFEFENTDIYEDVFDLSDEEYIDLLSSKRPQIEAGILEGFKTKRRNLYIPNYHRILDNVLNKHRVKRLTTYVGVYTNSDIDVQFMQKVFDELTDQGKILTAKTKSGTGYRAITARDIKEKTA